MTRAFALLLVAMLLVAGFVTWRLGGLVDRQLEPPPREVAVAPAAPRLPVFPYDAHRAAPLVRASTRVRGEDHVRALVRPQRSVIRKVRPEAEDLAFETFVLSRERLHDLVSALVELRGEPAPDARLVVVLIEDDGDALPVAIAPEAFWRLLEAHRDGAALRPQRPRALDLSAEPLAGPREDTDLVWPLRRPTIEALLERPHRIVAAGEVERAAGLLREDAAWRDESGGRARVRVRPDFDGDPR